MKKIALLLTVLLFGLALFSTAFTKDSAKQTTIKIKMVSVFVNNPVEAFTFYTEVLGFIEKTYMPDAYLAIVASPEEPEGTELLLEPKDHPIAKTYQEAIYKEGLPVLVLGVDDIQKEYNRLKKLGVVFKKVPTPTAWGIEAIFDDTCGNFIMLYQADKSTEKED